MLLSPPLAHPDTDNSPSVSLCLLWREPCTSQPSAQAHLKPPSLFLQELFLCPLLSDFVASLFFLSTFCFSSSVSLPSCFVPFFFLLVSQILTFPCSFYFAITHSPVRSIYLRVAESLSSHRPPLYATVIESSLLCLLSCHSPALHLQR